MWIFFFLRKATLALFLKSGNQKELGRFALKAPIQYELSGGCF